MRILFLIFALANYGYDGHVYHYNTTNGLEDVHDRNGVSLTYTNNGIISSTGAKITYTRDSATDRITAITDPSGKQIAYAYDSNGNLITKTTTTNGQTWTYSYDLRNRLAFPLISCFPSRDYAI